MIHIILGKQGSGKTLLLVKKAEEYYKKGIPVYANFHLKNIPYSKIKYQDIIDCKYKKAVVLIDEVHLLLPSRTWYKESSKKICDAFLSQVRKQELELYCTTQLLRKLDVRLRDEKDFTYVCNRYIKLNNGDFRPLNFSDYNVKKDTPSVINVDVYDEFSGDKINFSFHANKYYDEYDTNEIVKVEGLE